MPTRDLVVSWVSRGSSEITQSFREVCPQKPVCILLASGSCSISPEGEVTLPEPYPFEVYYKESRNGGRWSRSVSSGKSKELRIHPSTQLRVHMPNGILLVMNDFPP